MNEDEEDFLIFDDFEVIEEAATSILHVKQKNDLYYYIEFDIFSRELTEISPVEIVQPRSFRHNIFVRKKDSIIIDLLQAKIPISKVRVNFDPKTSEHDLIRFDQRKRKSGEYFFIQNKKDVRSPIHIDCNLVLKKISVTLNPDEFKKFISSSNIEENDINLADEIQFYCFDEDNPTLLRGGFKINSKQLLTTHQVSLSCHWLPNDPRHFEKFTFMHMGARFNISFGTVAPGESNESLALERPQILYKQQGSTVSFQSIMNNVDNYKVRDDVNFYCYKQDDPARLLDKIKIPKENLDKFNQFSVQLDYSDKIKILSDHEHLYIEDNDVSAYYKF